jgi:hypothetical protein
MPAPVTAEVILGDIEFELVQGAPGSDSLGEAVERIQRYQNERRAQAARSKHSGGKPLEALNHLFQINDMILKLFREVDARLLSLQLELRRSYGLPPRAPDWQADLPGAGSKLAEAATPLGVTPTPDGDADLPARKVDDLNLAMQADSLELRLQINRSQLPVIGGLLTRLRSFLHARGLLYARTLASKQGSINRVYGDWLLYLNSTNHAQQVEIASLRAELAALRAEQKANGPGQ